MSCVYTHAPHELKTMLSMSSGMTGACYVVRWCAGCGAIVVDEDVDGRVAPGAHTAMKFPVLARQEEARQKAASGVKGGSDAHR